MREWAKHGGYAAFCETESLPSKTAALVSASKLLDRYV